MFRRTFIFIEGYLSSFFLQCYLLEVSEVVPEVEDPAGASERSLCCCKLNLSSLHWAAKLDFSNSRLLSFRRKYRISRSALATCKILKRNVFKKRCFIFIFKDSIDRFSILMCGPGVIFSPNPSPLKFLPKGHIVCGKLY